MDLQEYFYGDGKHLTRDDWIEVINRDINATLNVGHSIEDPKVRNSFFSLQYLELVHLLEAAKIFKREES